MIFKQIADIDSVLIPDFGWEAVNKSDKIKIWTDNEIASYLAIAFVNNLSEIINIKDVGNIKSKDIRKDVVINKLLREGKIFHNELNNLYYDSLDNIIIDDVLMNISEEEIYDNVFPLHPLSIVRKLMSKIISEIKFKPEIKKIVSSNK